MNRLEQNCADAVADYLKTGAPTSETHPVLLAELALAAAQFAALPPVAWDSEDEATMPRVSIRVTQGEEAIYLTGIYALTITLEIVARATKRSEIDKLDAAVNTLLGDHLPLAKELTNPHFWCYGRAGGNSRTSTSGDGKRTYRADIVVLGFDLDRFPGIGEEVIGDGDAALDFGGGVGIDTAPGIPEVIGDGEGNAIDFGGGTLIR